MLYNVWMVIWPNQQIVIANVRAVAAGGDANPDAAASVRKGAMASRQNTIFSFTVLWFMLGVTHIYVGLALGLSRPGRENGSSSSSSARRSSACSS